MPFDFLARIERLSPTNLTLREQARLEMNPNDLRWRAIAPKQNVNSTTISEFTNVDFRPAGGRRAWNAQPREIPDVLGPQRKIKISPVNPSKHFDEEYLQEMQERAANPAGGIVRELYDGGVIMGVDEWAQKNANAADVQIERDWFETWYFNRLTVMDPKTGEEVVVQVGIDAGRYVLAAATLAAAPNAWRAFLGYARDARTKLGSLGAVRLRQSAMNEILQDAPAANGDVATLESVTARMAAEGFPNFRFVVDERTYDAFVDGGSVTVQTHYVPEGRMAFQPANGIVGATYFAPVTRAWNYVDPNRVRNVRDFTVFYSEKNDGKTLLNEAQANALSLPTEQFTYVVHGI